MRKKGYVYRSMFLSYMLILLIPVLISMILYYYTYGIVRTQVKNHNKDLMVTIKSVCDREFEYYQSVLQNIYTNDMVRELLSSKSVKEQEEGWKVLQVKETLTDAYFDVLMHSQHCRDLFIYYGKWDKIIGSAGAVSLELYSKSNYTDGDVDEFRSFLKEADSGDMLSYQSYADEEYVLLIKKLINAAGRNADAVVGIWINIKDLEARIHSIGWKYSSDWTIMNPKGQVFRKIDLLGKQDYDLVTIGGNGDVRSINGTDYLTSILESEVLDIRYALFTLETEISDSVKNIRSGHLFSLLVTLIIGSFMSRIFLQKHYNPIRKMYDLFTKKEDNIKNEYKYLEEQISLLVNGHLDICKDAERKEDVLRKYMLENLVLGSGVECDVGERCEAVYLKLNKGYNLVLLCSIFTDNNARNSMEEIDEEKEQKLSVISDIYTEQVGAKFDLEALIFEEQIVLIINMESNQENYSELLQDITESLHDVIAEKLHYHVYVMEGGLYPGLEGVRQSYLEACSAEDFLHYVDEIYIRYEDIKNLQANKYDYSFEMEERIINTIRDGNWKRAVSFVNSVLENNFGRKDEYSTEMLTCLLYDIFSTLIKAGEEKGIRNDKFLAMNHIDVGMPLEEIKSFFGGIVEEISEEDQTASENNRIKSLSRDIMEYVKENYMDPNLNVSQTALHFGITPSYLSAIFKKSTGKSIMEVIEQERIRNARKLLEEGMGVANVAACVGFRERTTFIRSFKRNTGVTPGSVKKVKSDSLQM